MAAPNPSRPWLNRAASLACLAALALSQPGAWAEFGPLPDDERAAIDRRALDEPDGPATEIAGPFFGGITGWAVSRAPLPDDEELRRAREAYEALTRERRIAPTPAAAAGVLKTLTAEVPASLQPRPLGFTLTVVEDARQPAFTLGAGYLVISQDLVESLLLGARAGRDRLAFVLAHEMGHNARGHCRRGYHLLALQEAARDGALREADAEGVRALADAAVDTSGSYISFIYGRRQDYEADLFAVHLCRNAGFDVENGLDVLRRAAEAELAGETAGGRAAGIVARGAPALERLKHLRQELDGVLDGPSLGLMRFDPQTQQFVPAEDDSVPEGRRAVVLVHGIGSSLAKLVAMAKHLAEQSDEDGPVLLGFQWTGDASLARMGRALRNEIERVVASPEQADFVCHSAGGLVFRWYAEVEERPFSRAIFLGTPHGGSDLARLRYLLEVQQFVGDVRLGFLKAIENTVADGDGQIGHDLAVDSLFLARLNRGRPDVSRYYVFRGRRFGPLKAVLLGASSRALQEALERVAPRTIAAGPFRKNTEAWIEKLRLPREVLDGDLAVTLDSATLEGVEHVETLEAGHHELQEHPQVIEGVAKIVLEP
ncbi:MAG: M48 family metalloprotease [Planctomycetes bacterium]|nr:M48 family metalloprotease [Planctomycetota bacterium]